MMMTIPLPQGWLEVIIDYNDDNICVESVPPLHLNLSVHFSLWRSKLKRWLWSWWSKFLRYICICQYISGVPSVTIGLTQALTYFCISVHFYSTALQVMWDQIQCQCCLELYNSYIIVHCVLLCTMHCILVWALQCFGHDLRDKLPPSCCPFASPIIFWKSDHHDNNEDGENGDDGEEEEDDDDENGDDDAEVVRMMMMMANIGMTMIMNMIIIIKI